MIRNKKILRGLTSEEYEHLFERRALDSLEATPGLGAVGKFLTKHTVERISTIQYTGSYLKVNKSNCPKIYEYLEHASLILGYLLFRSFMCNGDTKLMRLQSAQNI